MSVAGTIATHIGEEIQEIQQRIYKANKIFFELLPIINSKITHQKTKLNLYETMILPVVCYECET